MKETTGRFPNEIYYRIIIYVNCKMYCKYRICCAMRRISLTNGKE